MSNKPIVLTHQFIAVVPAAGAGKRMLANCPKQYLTIDSALRPTGTSPSLHEYNT